MRLHSIEDSFPAFVDGKITTRDDDDDNDDDYDGWAVAVAVVDETMNVSIHSPYEHICHFQGVT